MFMKRVIEEVVRENAPGPSPSFTIYDAVRFLSIIASEGLVGRARLSEMLGLGEGATRTLILKMVNKGLISTSKKGCKLTEKGEKIWRSLKAHIPVMVELKEKNELTLARYNVAVLVRGGANVRKGLEQRDASIRAGAKGASTIVVKHGRLILPAVSDDVSRDFPKAFTHIIQSLNPEEGDVVIICSADSLRDAERGSIAAAWTII
ncbi:MAG: DUF4443 domain-containing protein [Nitrososphaerota archaeon]|nr:DUF4443 domain-containing protein [Candidatus Bathyarchaeota archaeon]MDW8049281.1 DUF4443 domain-containing protein [Nitrososphaerota archaeon]